MRELHTVSQHIVARTINPQSLHRVELAVAGHWRVVLHIAADTSNLQGNIEVPPGVRANRAIQARECKAWRHYRGDDSVQLVLPRNSGPKRQRLKDIGRVLVERSDRRAR